MRYRGEVSVGQPFCKFDKEAAALLKDMRLRCKAQAKRPLQPFIKIVEAKTNQTYTGKCLYKYTLELKKKLKKG